jgi:hypothetical protein
MLNGIVSPLPPSAPRTAETACSLLPTPVARDDGKTPEAHVAMKPLLPTPTETDSANSRRSTARTDEWESNTGTTLTDAALELIGANTAPRSDGGKSSSAGLRLNPSFVEWMMGAPDRWTDPDCPLSATQFSSRPAG